MLNVYNTLNYNVKCSVLQEYQERGEDQSRTMERILILARNVLQVPADPDVEKRPDNDASVHDQVGQATTQWH